MGWHYIPQYYLAGFTVSADQDMIWQYDRDSGRGKCLPRRIVAQSTRLYSSDVERYLANDIEKRAHPVLAALGRERRFPSDQEKYTLCRYLSVLLTRVPAHLRNVDSLVPALREDVFADLRAELARLAVVDPAGAALRQAEAENAMERWAHAEKGIPDDQYYEIVRPRYLPGVAKVLWSMRWVFVEQPHADPLITSDMPLYFDHRRGLGKPDSQFWFPVSSDLLLIGRNDRTIKQGFALRDARVFRQANRQTASNADRFVYSPIEADWLPKILGRKRTCDAMITLDASSWRGNTA